MSMPRLALTALSLALSLPAVAQGPLRLSVVGGSYPGRLDVAVDGGNWFQLAFVAMGIDPGPVPLSVIDPADSRIVDVGVQQLELYWGVFDFDGHFALPGWNVPNVSAFLDVPLFFQALSYGGATTVFDQLSPPEAIRFAPAGAFRDRQVYLAEDRAFGTALALPDGRWMIAGGGRGALLAQVASRTSEIYDDVTDTFVYGPQMNEYRSLHTATKLADGRWLFAGGVNITNDPQALCEILDPVAGTFTAVAPMGTARAGHAAVLLGNGRVFVSGGLDTVTTGIDTIDHTLNTTELYDPATNTWTPGPNLRTPRVGHIPVVRPNGTVLLAGGVSYDNLILVKIPTVRTTTDLYNPASNSIVAGPTMATARSLIDAAPLANDRWLFAGGISTMNLTNQGTPTANAEVYDAVANTFSSAGAMATARANQRSIALPGNRLLLVGGANGAILTPTPLASGEIYDAATNSWSVGPSLNLARAGAVAFPTPHGQVHVMGGGTTTGAIARVCEWWYY